MEEIIVEKKVSTESIKHLLQNVAVIQKKYDDIAKITGENFNVFSVMNMEHNEVYTHSAIIGELLNPNGSHCQGDIFLKLFVEEINKNFTSEEDKIELDHFGTLVKDKICERTISIGNNWDNVTGGRIDLIVEDHKQILIIENKIYAIDQPYQLIRYKKYAENKASKKAFLFYLTLDGRPLKKEEETYAINEVNIKGYNFKHNEKNEYVKFKEDCIDKDNIHHCLYYPISFKNHIKDWIEKCLEKTHSLPIIRETLTQYLHLVKKLTKQTINNEMNQEIKKLIENDFGTATSFVNAYNDLNNETKQKLIAIYQAIDTKQIEAIASIKFEKDSDSFRFKIDVDKYSFYYEVVIENLGFCSYAYDQAPIPLLLENGINALSYNGNEGPKEIANKITEEILKIISILK